MNPIVAMANVSMRKRPAAVGELFHKAGRPRIVWIVERLSFYARLAHVVLMRVDDPTTKITVSADTLSTPLYFCRSMAPSRAAN